MYVCMYVCMYVRTYVGRYVCMYVCMYVCAFICFFVLSIDRVTHVDHVLQGPPNPWQAPLQGTSAWCPPSGRDQESFQD